jgi:preprotein translocase subunit SecE
MAEDKPKRRIRKVETVRERAEKAETPRKPRRVRQVASSATGGLKTVGSAGRKQFHPFKLPDNKVGRFLGKSRKLTPGFLRGAWAELRQVTWPNRKETTKLTTAVLIFAFVFGGVIALTDYGLDKLFRQLILK